MIHVVFIVQLLSEKLLHVFNRTQTNNSMQWKFKQKLDISVIFYENISSRIRTKKNIHQIYINILLLLDLHEQFTFYSDFYGPLTSDLHEQAIVLSYLHEPLTSYLLKLFHQIYKDILLFR